MAGCGCDVPSHAYTFNFALNPDWPRYFSYSSDIQKYLLKVVEVFDLRKYMTFNTEVVKAEWHEDTAKWRVKLRQSIPGSSETREYDDECDVLLHITGILNNFKWPKIPGIDTFKGRFIHTADWPNDYQKEQWEKESVAVIGSGASSIQTVPHMQPYVKHLDVFVRTGVWFVEFAGNFGHNKVYTDDEIKEFRRDANRLVAHAKQIESSVNVIWPALYSGSEMQKGAQDLFRNRMKDIIKDERLFEGFNPKFELGCKLLEIQT